mmetsp:Transcript_29083/g.86114  ORF Transcript_29083/g.86114 Transcript_29083/m.86114 type:complete len:567 (-) Transcript_29083:48-1748(-)
MPQAPMQPAGATFYAASRAYSGGSGVEASPAGIEFARGMGHVPAGPLRRLRRSTSASFIAAGGSSRASLSQLGLKAALNLSEFDFLKDLDSLCGSGAASPSCMASATRHASSACTQDEGTGRSSLRSDADKGCTPRKHTDAVTATTEEDQLAFLSAMNAPVDCQPEESNSIVLSPNLPPGMMRARWSIKDYKLLRHVHHGYASDVYQAECQLSGRVVALKLYSVDQLDDIPRVQLSREIRLHSACAHKHVLQFFAAFMEELERPAPEGSGLPPTRQRVAFIVVDWAGGGNLQQFMHNHGGVLSEPRAINLVVLPMLKCLRYLHNMGVVHRDLKPENMLFDDSLSLKMADFGLAIDINTERANTRAGTLDYMAPEVLMCPTKASPADFKLESQSRQYTVGVDAWAVGAVFYELLTGSPPFRTTSMRSTAKKIVAGDVVFPDGLSDSAKDFIRACLRVDPRDRPTVHELLEHPLLLKMQRQALFMVAARRSSNFVDFISMQVHKERRAAQRMRERQRSDGWLRRAMSSGDCGSGDSDSDDGDDGDGDDYVEHGSLGGRRFQPELGQTL